jgi:hypothetical protein
VTFQEGSYVKTQTVCHKKMKAEIGVMQEKPRDFWPSPEARKMLLSKRLVRTAWLCEQFNSGLVASRL